MVVDVGGGTTEVAVISLGGIVTSLSIRTAGDDLDQAIVAWMKKEYSPDAGRAHRRGDQDDPRLGVPAATTSPRPRSAAATWSPGCPRTVVVSSAEVRQALEEPLHAIVDAVRATLDQTPPELAGDIMDRGIVLTGGGALLRGLDERLRHETGMPVHVAEDPLTRSPWAPASASRSSRRCSRCSSATTVPGGGERRSTGSTASTGAAASSITSPRAQARHRGRAGAGLRDPRDRRPDLRPRSGAPRAR